jgi:hypothetical protein
MRGFVVDERPVGDVVPSGLKACPLSRPVNYFYYDAMFRSESLPVPPELCASSPRSHALS